MDKINKRKPSSYQALLYACPCCKKVVKLNISTTRDIEVTHNTLNTSVRDILKELQFWDAPELRCKHCDSWMIALDENISQIVLKLWKFGVRTHSSCEGHVGKRSYVAFRKTDDDYPIHSTRGYVHIEGIVSPYVDIVDNGLVGKALQTVVPKYFEEYKEGFYCPAYFKLNITHSGHDIYRLTVLPHRDAKTLRQRRHRFEIDADSPLVIVSQYFSQHSDDYKLDEIYDLNPILVPERSDKVAGTAQRQLDICREVLGNTIDKILELRVSAHG